MKRTALFRLYFSFFLGVSFRVETDTIFPGTSQRFSVRLGTGTARVAGAYGVAFTVSYDDRAVVPESVGLDFGASWLRQGAAAPRLVMLRNDVARRRILLRLITNRGVVVKRWVKV